MKNISKSKFVVLFMKYFHKDMGRSNSIKAVVPALYPNDPELDYHALPVVHNAGEAMDLYPKMLVA